MTTTTRAGIARRPHTGWEIVELSLDEPKAHEVRVRFHAAGLCHSDAHLVTGDVPIPFPVVGGRPTQRVAETAALDFPLEDLTSLPLPERESAAARIASRSGNFSSSARASTWTRLMTRCASLSGSSEA